MDKIYTTLANIQQNLKCNKGQYNAYGKYNYRSCEDILESVKPLLQETKSILLLNDEMVTVGERYYVKATACLIDIKSGEKIEVSAFAREDETKKGMDGSQITGAASSYARKYALNGLFDIDDTKDVDALEPAQKTSATKTSQGIEEQQKRIEIKIQTLIESKGYSREDIESNLAAATSLDEKESWLLEWLK